MNNCSIDNWKIKFFKILSDETLPNLIHSLVKVRVKGICRNICTQWWKSQLFPKLIKIINSRILKTGHERSREPDFPLFSFEDD